MRKISFANFMIIMCLILAVILTGCSPKAVQPEDGKEKGEPPSTTGSGYPRTIVDSIGRTVTVSEPPKRIVVAFSHAVESFRTIKVPTESIVGVPSNINYAFFPEFSATTAFTGAWDPDVEQILALNPDLVILHPSSGFRGSKGQDEAQEALEAAGVNVLRLGFNMREAYPDELKKLAHIFDKSKEAEEYLNWQSNILDSITSRVQEILEENKPKVLFFSIGRDGTFSVHSNYAYFEETGGRDIFADQAVSSVGVDVEAILERNPDIMIRVAVTDPGVGDGVKDVTVLKELRDEIMNRPEFQNVTAVEEGRVYCIAPQLLSFAPGSGCRFFLQLVYQAKWFHPELFQDLDPKAIHQEYLTRFQGLNVDLEDFGVYVYHPEEHPNGR